MPTGQRKEFGTLLLVTLAAAALLAARRESATSLVWLFASSTFFVAVPWLVWGGLRTSLAAQLDRWLPLLVAVWVVLPLGCELVLRKFGVGDAFEITVLVCFQNAALVAAAFSHRPSCAHVAGLCAAFLCLFVVVISTSPAVYLLAGLFGVLVLWWLMARYWERVQHTVAAGRTDRGVPVRSWVLVAVVLISALMLVALGSTSASTYVLRGFMPASGGDRWNDEFARAGVNDGDAIVAAKEEALSFGPVESELFLDSDMPTLYDMLNDMFGDPPKPKTEQKRSIGLAPGEVREAEQRVATTKRSGREFSIVRRRAERKQSALDDLDAKAMLYVVGRTPLHLALERFDTFDGKRWTHSGQAQANPPIHLETLGGKPWAFCAALGESPIHRGTERHAVKIINLKTDRFPAPPQLTAIHVDQVNEMAFFGWTDDSMVHMPVRESIPQLTVIHLQSQGRTLEPLRVRDFTAQFSLTDRRRDAAGTVARHTVATADRPLIASTVAEWTQHVPRGWRQVEAVVRRLRQDFTLDPQASGCETCDDLVSHFLTERRGPSYLFATAAAVMLRDLGYTTRLVTGFYARGERFDRLAGQTAVLAEDVHVWAEVYVGGLTWVTIEPTPGYASPPEKLTWWQTAVLWMGNLQDWCHRHATGLIVAAIGLIATLKTRRAWLGVFGAAICGVLGTQSTAARLRWTIRLLEWRARLAGCPRPAQATISSWYAPLVRAADADAQRQLQRFFLWSERLLYSDRAIDPADHDEIVRACTAALVASRHRTIRAYLGVNLS